MAHDNKDRLTERPEFQDFISSLDNIAVWSGDKSGFDYMSPGFEDIWGRPVEDVLEDKSVVIEGTHPEDRDRVLAAMEDREDRIANGETIELEHRVVQPDGEVRWVEARVFPVYDASDHMSEVVGVTIDITDRKRTELELERQNERVERFTRFLAHDLRNPLNTAQGYLELLRKELDHEYLDPINQALSRIGDLITDVLALARTENEIEVTEFVGLNEVVQEAWSMIDSEEGTLIVDSLPRIVADPGHLRQLFENLFRNAIEHSEQDVTVQVGPLPDRKGFYIADDGPGIPEADREEVFEVGYSTSKSGTGLGLVIVKEIVDAHDWTISVMESDEGGARFEIANIDGTG